MRIQACFVNATLKQNATEKQSAPGSTVSKKSPTVLQTPPAKQNIAADKEMHLRQDENVA